MLQPFTEKIRRNPYSIILLDEIEKSHPDVHHIFLQFLEDGGLTDSQGRTVNFKETVIIMTSNIGVGSKNITVGFGKSEGEEESNLMNSLNLYFKPEFLNRFDNIIEFKSLDRENLIQIANLMINELKTTLLENEITLMYRRKLKIKLQNLELIQGLEHVH